MAQELTERDLELQAHISKMVSEWKPAPRLMVSHTVYPVYDFIKKEYRTIIKKH